MWQNISYKFRYGLLKFFRNTLAPLEESDILELSKNYENQTKQIKDDVYRIGWYMRGSFSYDDLMFKITSEDRDILNAIIKENIETVNKTKMPLL